MLNTINWKKGIVTYNEFHIVLDKPLEEQIFELEEDLLQVKYGNMYCIDVGWYPSLEPDGYLWIRVIGNREWDKPLFSKRVANLIWFPKVLQEAIDFADDVYSNQQSTVTLKE